MFPVVSNYPLDAAQNASGVSQREGKPGKESPPPPRVGLAPVKMPREYSHVHRLRAGTPLLSPEITNPTTFQAAPVHRNDSPWEFMLVYSRLIFLETHLNG